MIASMRPPLLLVACVLLFCNTISTGVNCFLVAPTTLPPPPTTTTTRLWTTTTKLGSSLSGINNTNENNANASPSSPSKTDISFTSAVLNITYDGAHFTGWSSASNSNSKADAQENNEDDDQHDNGIENTNNGDDDLFPPLWLSKKQRRRKKRQKGTGKQGQGFVRGVEGIIQQNLAKVYGKVDPQRVFVEGCSRTDKGVHATSMIAQFYCLTPEATAALSQQKDAHEEHNEQEQIHIHSSIPGKRVPHPISSTDDRYFLPITLDLQNLQYRLNRMLPDDVRINNISPSPAKNTMQKQEQRKEDEEETDILPFHPTLDSISKTYQYTFSIGTMHDPTQWRFVWHIPYDGRATASKDATYDQIEQIPQQEQHPIIQSFDLALAQQACNMLLGHRNFAAFRGAPRGSDDKRRQHTESTLCTISTLHLEKVIDAGNSFSCAVPTTATYRITVTGDRFLYKMVRFMAGALVAVGTHNLTLKDIEVALESGSFDKQFVCAPPHGLTLRDVTYGDDIQFDWIY